MIAHGIRRWGQRFGLGLPPSTGTREALQWLMLGRLGVLYLLLCVIVLQQVFRGNGIDLRFGLRVGYALLALSFFFNLLHALVVDRVPDRFWVAASHIIFDAGVTTAWLFFSNGRESLFALLYLVQILLVSLMLYQKGALFAAISASLGFGLVMLVHPQPNGALVWGIYSALFLTLGVVGGYLSEELRRTTASLNEKSRKMQRLRAQHESILVHLPTGLLTVDSELRVKFLNPAGAQILGCDAVSAVGRLLAEIEPGVLPFFARIDAQEVTEEPEEGEPPSTSPLATAVSATGDERHRSFFVQDRSEGGRLRLQQRVELGEGKKRRVLRGDVAELDVETDHSALGRVLSFQDVTKLLNLEEKLKQNEKLAAVGQLAAGIAHEIRNPLASMSASIEMLKGSLPPGVTGGENQKLMDIAIREIDRLNSLITEFLDFVKPDKFRVVKVEVDKLLAEVVLAAKQSKNTVLSRVVGKGAAAEPKGQIEFREALEVPTVAHANAEKLRQVIWNLVVNAIQAMDKAGTIEVGCGPVGPHRVKFWVQDEGQGMSEETLTHLYEPFYTTKDKGTGLGLATAYKIIEAHHGEIRVKSRPGHGTRFEVFLQKEIV